jgi:hypothetical protein
MTISGYSIGEFFCYSKLYYYYIKPTHITRLFTSQHRQVVRKVER